MPLDNFKQIQDFRIQVVVTLEGFRLGNDNPVSRIAWNQIFVNRIIQRPMNQSVVMLNGGRLDPFQFFLIKSENILFGRSEERRVGKECGFRWSQYSENNIVSIEASKI